MTAQGNVEVQMVVLLMVLVVIQGGKLDRI